MNQENELIQFIRENNYFVSKNNENIRPNFLSMTGGSWYIPEHKIDDFYNIIRRMCVKNTIFSIVEVRTQVFKYYIDLDFQTMLAINMLTIKKICFKIHETIIDNISEATSLSHITQYAYCAEPREIKKDVRNLIKTGVHIYYPDILVTSEIALSLRERLIYSLLLIDKDLDWNNIVDESVYKNAGLRLPHMPKLKKCKCHKENGECVYGCFNGVLNDNGVYNPHFSINGKQIESLDKLKNNIKHSLSITKIRSNSQNPNIALVPQDDSNSNIDTFISNNNRRTKRIQTNLKNTFYTESDEILSPDIQMKIQNIIRKSYDEYKSININYVKKILYKSHFNNSIYTKYIVNTTCKFCLNINSNHNSNNIYFLIYISGNNIQLTQRCHCTCDKPHIGTTHLCKTYSSPPIEIKSTTDLYKLLMPPILSKNEFTDNYETSVAHHFNFDVNDDVTNKKAIGSRLMNKKKNEQSFEKINLLNNVDTKKKSIKNIRGILT